MLTKIENIFTSWSVTLLGLIILKKVANNLVGLSLWDLYTVLHSDTESLWEMPDVNSGPVLLIYSVKYFVSWDYPLNTRTLNIPKASPIS